ncbi:MAG TPA: PQQ-dependent sugar dehydrogenase [Pirellulales bacterium]|jgi:glucose/arabinose dehydrogenase
MFALKMRPARSRGSKTTPAKRRLLGEMLEARQVLTALPTGFTETLITSASDLTAPTAMEFSPTGQLWVLEQGGRAKLVRADGTTQTALTLSVDSAGERGLLGITFDPAYDGAGPNTDFVYLYYTTPRSSPTNPSHNRISRFTVTGAGTTLPTLGSELILRDLPPENEDNNLATDGDTNHNGGAMHIGPDGKLYVAVGDHNYDVTPQSDDVSQTLTTPFGKILRLNLNGSNPSDNPFFDGSTTDWQGATWALGLRNPFTFAFQPGTGRMFVNDVGESNWEEINDGQRAANYGWAGSTSPLWEGFNSPPPSWTNYRDPIMAYDHSSSAPTPAGVAITGGAFYPANGNFGSAYARKYFFADFGANFIRVFDPAHPGTVSVPDTSVGFASNMTTAGPVDLKIDAAGNLYYLATGGEIYRISFSGAFGPTAVVNRRLFYNDSQYDGNNVAANSTDDAAIATDKVAYRPGTGAASFANVSSYSKGINGIMIDVSGNLGPISAADFIFRVGNNNAPSTWATASVPSAVIVRPGAGVGGSNRVEITWPSAAIQKQWLEVIVRGNDATGGNDTRTGLASSDVFFFGNSVGDTGASDTGTFANVNAMDELDVRHHYATSVPGIPVSNLYDIDRDGDVDALDELTVRNNYTKVTTAPRFLNIGNPPAAPEGPSAGAFASVADQAGASSDGSFRQRQIADRNRADTTGEQPGLGGLAAALMESRTSRIRPTAADRFASLLGSGDSLRELLKLDA